MHQPFSGGKMEYEKQAYIYRIGMHKCVDNCFAQMPGTKGFNKSVERTVSEMLREFAHLVEGAVEENR